MPRGGSLTAAAKGDVWNVDELLKCGANARILDRSGRSPMDYAREGLKSTKSKMEKRSKKMNPGQDCPDVIEWEENYEHMLWRFRETRASLRKDLKWSFQDRASA